MHEYLCSEMYEYLDQLKTINSFKLVQVKICYHIRYFFKKTKQTNKNHQQDHFGGYEMTGAYARAPGWELGAGEGHPSLSWSGNTVHKVGLEPKVGRTLSPGRIAKD